MKKDKSTENQPVMIDQELMDDIFSHNDFVENLVNLIPPRLYFKKDVLKGMRKKKHQAINRKLEGENKNLSKAAKNKRAHLDPSLHKPVTEMILQMEQDEEARNNRTKKKRPGMKKIKHIKEEGKPGQTTVNGGLDDDLHSKLKASIDKMKGNRPNTAEWLEKRRLKRKLSTLKKKKKFSKSSKLEKGVTPENSTPGDGEAIKKEKGIKKESSQMDDMSGKEPAPVKEGEIQYSSVVFSETGVLKRKRGEFSGKNYKKMLTKVEREKEKLVKLEETDKEKAAKVKDKQNWKTALQRAEGIKVKDNPELLKKAIKKRDQQKKKSQEKWKDRLEQVEKKKDQQQQKRSKHIQERKDSKKKKGVQKAMKKGRYVQPF